MTWLQKRAYLLGTASLGILALGAYLGLIWAPQDIYQHNVMRIMYVHVPSAMLCYLGFFITLVGSILYLWKRDLKWDRLAAASAELGVLFTALTLATGSIWGKPVWGVFWTWDPRLTTTAILFVVYAGYLMLRILQTDPVVRARQAAVVGIIGFVDIPIVHQSVVWWRSLHQGPTFPLLQDPKLDDRMEVALMVNALGFALAFLFLLGQRLRLARLEGQRDELLWEEVQRV
ncbi:MAG: cytochrome c biogenesis protein CcsA [Chloroflexota bacterium]|nr:cytochrome c biogenesis protein CcsA [Chloroflexota bacterium]